MKRIYDWGVVGGLARPGEVQRDIVGIGPKIEIPGDELAADPDSLGWTGTRSGSTSPRKAVAGSAESRACNAARMVSRGAGIMLFGRSWDDRGDHHHVDHCGEHELAGAADADHPHDDH